MAVAASLAASHAAAQVPPWNSGDYGTNPSGVTLSGTPAVLTINGSGLGTLTNQGTIAAGTTNPSTGATAGIYATSGSTVALINNDGGTIKGSGAGLLNYAVVTQVINSGLISAFSGSSAIQNYGHIGTLTNSGTISGQKNGTINVGTGLKNGSGGRIDLLDNGQSGLIQGGGIGLETSDGNGNVIGTLRNGGTINGVSTDGIYNENGLVGTINNSGLIQGGDAGIHNSGNAFTIVAIGSLINSGTISGTARYGIFNTAAIGSIDNSGRIEGGAVGIQNSDSADINVHIDSLTNSGTISGLNSGIYNAGPSSFQTISGTIGSLSNSGFITGGDAAISNQGNIGTIVNTGRLIGANAIDNSRSSASITRLDNAINGAIVGTIHGSVNGVSNIGTIVQLNNNGVIVGHSSGGAIAHGINNTGTIGQLSNGGLISGEIDGMVNSGRIGTLSNSGTISGSQAGVSISGTASTIANNAQGRITGLTAIQNSASIGTLSNGGTLSGSQAGISVSMSGMVDMISNGVQGTINGVATGIVNAGVIGTLSNSGLISGRTALLLQSGTLGNMLNAGTIAGSIVNQSANALNIGGGSGTVFGTLTGLSGDIGALVSAGDVNFTGGNQLLNDNINVNSGAGMVTNAAGVLRVDHQITIQGNYHQNAGASLAIGIDPGATPLGSITDTGYGRLIVTGNATVEAGGTIALQKPPAFNYAVGQRYVAIQASGSGTDYQAANLKYSVAGFIASGTEVADSGKRNLVVAITDVAPVVNPPTGGDPTTGSGPTTGSESGTGGGSGADNTNTGTNHAATGANARSVLGALFRYTGINQDMLDVFNPALAMTDPNAANRAGAQLSPAATSGAVINGAMAAFGAVQGAAGNRIDTLRTASADGITGVATGETGAQPGMWGRAFGGSAKQGERDGISGYHANYTGFMVGADALVNPDWRAGGLFSYARTNVGNEGDNTGSSAHVDAYGLTAYTGVDGHPWYVNLTAGAAREHTSTVRQIGFTGFRGQADGSVNGMLYTAKVQAGYPMAAGAATVTPLAGLSYASLRQSGYTESGSGAALTVDAMSASSLRSELGGKIERSLQTSYGEVQPFVELGWRHEFHGTPLTSSASFAADPSGSTAFTAQGAAPLRNTAALSLGATMLRSKNLSLQARYTLEGAGGYTAQTGDLTLRWQY